MAWPKGVKRPKVKSEQPDIEESNGTAPEVKEVEVAPAASPVVKNGASAVKLEPLGPGQQYFEAPDGTVLIGEATNTHMWYRKGNNGKGQWINPKR